MSNHSLTQDVQKFLSVNSQPFHNVALTSFPKQKDVLVSVHTATGYEVAFQMFDLENDEQANFLARNFCR